MKHSIRNLIILSSVFSILVMVFMAGSASAVNYCVSGQTLPSNPAVWGNITTPTTYIFNSTSNSSMLDTACWDVGYPYEAITVVSKPFPNQCTSSYNAICTEDTENYSSSRTYYYANITNRFCVNTDGSTWRWIYSANGFAGIQANYSQICSGGANSIDNSCRAPLYYGKLRNGAINYSNWNATGTSYSVTQDVAAFMPTCYGSISGQATNSNGTALSGVNVTLLLVGPGTEKSYLSTLTNAGGTYSFPSVPATTYRVLFSLATYNDVIVSTKVNYTAGATINAVLSSGSCNYDCTTQSDPTRCSSACNGIGGCGFYNTTIASMLNGVLVNSNQILNIGGTNYSVTACTGTPTLYQQPSVRLATISCPVGSSVVVLQRIVLKDGQPVKVVVPVCKTS